MKELESMIDVERDVQLKMFEFPPKSNSEPKGIIVLVHGMAEHIERYFDFANLLSDNDYYVYGYNHRGHKDSIKSYDDYGYIKNKNHFHILVDDLNIIIDRIILTHPNKPIYLFGHSMGSFVSQRFIQLYGKKVNGVILSASSKRKNSLLSIGAFLSKFVIRFKGENYRSKFLHKLAFAKHNRKIKDCKTDLDWLNRDEEEVQKYINDPYCGGVFAAGFYRDLFEGLKTINSNYELIPKDLPIFIIGGTGDPVGGYSNLLNDLVTTYKKIKMKNINYKFYDQARHELLLEINKDEIMNDCLNWFNNIK